MFKSLTAIAALFFSSMTFANCEFTIEGNDAMQFNKKSMEVPKSCETVKVTLKHTGKIPKKSMGHNWVLTTKGDMQAVASAGMSAGLDNNYLPAGDERIIAATDIIGGGEQTTVEFSTKDMSADGEYMFFCSFPGHSALMKGTFKLI
ncbi:azurin [Pseudoalteromonas ruthenica]|uniref:azurin n=1 Tax=Pseudoalteromonas ruthenica TaxID=151081 RepID=UPI00241CFA98|nr:azurin [Pseudoalteromonas ruthenica]